MTAQLVENCTSIAKVMGSLIHSGLNYLFSGFKKSYTLIITYYNEHNTRRQVFNFGYTDAMIHLIFLWNSLPADLDVVTPLSGFKSKL